MGFNLFSSRRQMLSRAWIFAAGLVSTGFWGTAGAASTRFAKKKEEKKFSRWGMVMDLRRCTNVRACTLACKAENQVPLGSWNTAVREIDVVEWPTVDKEFLPLICNHCEGNEKDGVPPCVKNCPKFPDVNRTFKSPSGEEIEYRGGATYKRPDGLILVDNELCIGCGKCIRVCPYGSRSYNKLLISGKNPEKNGISKCTFCVHRIDRGIAPACVEACPNRARIFGDLNDPESEVSKVVAEFGLADSRDDSTLFPEYGTRPSVFYIDPKKALKHYKISKASKGEEFRDLL